MKKEMLNNGKSFREVTLDRGGFDRFYKNPLTRVYQYEYALYSSLSDLFASVRSNSKCLESLKLYFKELPTVSEKTDETAQTGVGKKGKSREDILSEMAAMTERDVIGNVTFPMMQECMSEVRVATRPDGTHTFIFTDGIYGFKAHLAIDRKSRPGRIVVESLYPTYITKDTHKHAACKSAA